MSVEHLHLSTLKFNDHLGTITTPRITQIS